MSKNHIGQMEGTPFHIENLYYQSKNRRRCINHDFGVCRLTGNKCITTSDCKKYVESGKPAYINPGKYTIRKAIPYGSFEVIYLDDNEIISKNIGLENSDNIITIDTELVKEVLKHDVGDIFKVNSEEVKLINKNIKYK